MKLNSNEFKVIVNNFSKEHKVSKRKARQVIFWKVVYNEKLALNKSTVSYKTLSVSKSKISKFSNTKSSQKPIVTEKQKDTSFHHPMSVIDKFPINRKIKHIRKFDNIRKYEKSQQVVTDQKLKNV